MRISQAAFDLIVSEEVTSKDVYERKYRRPEWPGASSGATVGIGYDLGQTPSTTIEADWRGRVPDSALAAMLSCSGRTGPDGKAATAAVRALIDVPWETAVAVHKECVLPRWEARTAATLPNTDKLSADSFGALVSLTFNRGASYGRDGERYREMRAIKSHMAGERFGRIPDELRSMKRLWPDLKGLLRRRDREADLFARGLVKPALPVEPAKEAGKIIVATVAATTTAWYAGLSTETIIAIGVVAAAIVFAAIFAWRRK